MGKKAVKTCKYYNSAGTCKWLSLLFMEEVREGVVKVTEKACIAIQNADCPILEQSLKIKELELRVTDLE
jgi:hypothetical protein